MGEPRLTNFHDRKDLEFGSYKTDIYPYLSFKVGSPASQIYATLQYNNFISDESLSQLHVESGSVGSMKSWVSTIISNLNRRLRPYGISLNHVESTIIKTGYKTFRRL